MNPLQRLRALTEGLDPVPAAGDPVTAAGVFKGRYLALMKLHTIAGSETLAHAHSGKHEWIGVITGNVKVVFEDDGTEIILNPYDTCHIAPGRKHKIIAISDALTWCITVPPDEDYPDPDPAPAKSETGD